MSGWEYQPGYGLGKSKTPFWVYILPFSLPLFALAGWLIFDVWLGLPLGD